MPGRMFAKGLLSCSCSWSCGHGKLDRINGMHIVGEESGFGNSKIVQNLCNFQNLRLIHTRRKTELLATNVEQALNGLFRS